MSFILFTIYCQNHQFKEDVMVWACNMNMSDACKTLDRKC